MEGRLRHLGINGDDAVNYLNQKSAEMWQSWMSACQLDPKQHIQKGCGASGKISLHTLNSTVDEQPEDGLARGCETESDDEFSLTEKHCRNTVRVLLAMTAQRVGAQWLSLFSLALD